MPRKNSLVANYKFSTINTTNRDITHVGVSSVEKKVLYEKRKKSSRNFKKKKADV